MTTRRISSDEGEQAADDVIRTSSSTTKVEARSRRSRASRASRSSESSCQSSSLAAQSTSTRIGSRIQRGRKRAFSESKRVEASNLGEPALKTKKMTALIEVDGFEYEHDEVVQTFGHWPSTASGSGSGRSSPFTPYADENHDPYWMEAGASSVENPAFRALSHALDESKLRRVPVPAQLTEKYTRGLGSPEKVWELMVRTDEIVRPTDKIMMAHPKISQKMRHVLIDWMMEVCSTEKQHRETFHLAVDYVDRYLLNSDDIPLESFQLLGTTAIFIASKYEEIYPPKLEEIVQYTDNACNEEDVRRMEIILLQALQWTLSPVTSLHWLGAFMQLLGKKEMPTRPVGDEHVVPEHPCVVPDIMREDFVHMAKILDLCIMDTRSLRFSYRELAAAVLFSCLEPIALISQVTGFAYETLAPAIEWVEPFVRYCERRRSIGDPLPRIDGIKSDDLHNIQTLGVYSNIDDAMLEIGNERKEILHKQRELRTAGKRAVLRARTRR